MARALLLAFAFFAVLPAPADAQAPACDLATLFSHLSDIQGACCVGGNACSSGYPGAADACDQACGELFEPFWDSTFPLTVWLTCRRHCCRSCVLSCERFVGGYTGACVAGRAD